MFSNRVLVLAVAVVALLVVGDNVASAGTIDFEGAFLSLGFQGNPVSFYQASEGVRFEGSNWGLLAGVSRGDPGNFDLEGTNGPASLAVNRIGHVIDMKFASPFTSLSLDLGIDFAGTSIITVDTYLGGVLQDSTVINRTDTLNNGLGTWYSESWANRDRVRLTATGGWRAWAIDNLQIVPEPASLALLGLGVLAVVRKRRKKTA